MALTIRPNTEQQSLIDDLLSRTGIKTASKLFFHVLLEYQKQREQIHALEKELYEKRTRLNKLERISTDLDESLSALFNRDK